MMYLLFIRGGSYISFRRCTKREVLEEERERRRRRWENEKVVGNKLLEMVFMQLQFMSHKLIDSSYLRGPHVNL